MPEFHIAASEDLINQPFETGVVYYNKQIDLFVYFTGEYNSTGDPIFEFDRGSRMMVRKEEFQDYIPIRDPGNFAGFLEQITQNFKWIAEKELKKLSKNRGTFEQNIGNKGRVERLHLSKEQFRRALDRASKSVHSWPIQREPLKNS
ncbi:hypothetical protein HYW74_03610 [Candidatus Pacearchaeota archaeon]|nr:hypothetical protein [Candidatus Pacearchaeota archaeon]